VAGWSVFSLISYNSQPTFVIPWVDAAAGNAFTPIYMGDNWNPNGPGGVGNASYLWLPMRKSKGAVPWTITYEEGWMQAQMAAGTDLTTWAY